MLFHTSSVCCHQMRSIWHALSLLGDSRFLLPVVLCLAIAGILKRHAWALRWLLGVLAVLLTTLATKVAFLGWGIGITRLDFTGFSGHAAMSAAVWPVVLYLCLPNCGTKRWAAGTGLLLAAVIAYSRLPLNAHSWMEVASGWLLGAAASGWTLSALSRAPYRLNVRMMSLGIAAGLSLSIVLPRTHDAVVHFARTLASGERVANKMRGDFDASFKFMNKHAFDVLK